MAQQTLEQPGPAGTTIRIPALYPLVYPAARWKVRALCRLLGGWRVEGIEHLPRAGGVIIASTHVSYADPPIVGAAADGTTAHVPTLPLRGEIDIVGAGDAVTANLATALAAGATVAEAITLANIAASVVIHQLGTTGTATTAQIAELLES